MRAADFTVGMVVDIKLKLIAGEKQHRIAANYDINSARVSEIKFGKKFDWIPPDPEFLNDNRIAHATSACSF